MDDDDISDGITYTFRLADGSPLVATPGPYFKTHFAELFRSVRAKHGWVELVGFDARADDQPDVIAEHEELRRRMHEARLATGWTPRARASA
jgi:hypothetical protein